MTVLASNNADKEAYGELSSRQPKSKLEKVALGNEKAIWELITEQQDVLRRVCIRVMGGNLHDAEDALSRINLKLWEEFPAQAGRLEEQYVPRWLSRVARNFCIDLLRKRVTEMNQKIRNQYALEHAVAVEQGPEQSAIYGELIIRLQQALDELPEAHREAAKMRFVEDSPYPVIALQQRTSQANARKRIQLIRSRLRSDLESFLGGEILAQEPRG